ncbi:hypothetical protein [Cerasicoccus fimbriatus]|uniref:hypothetical protein n=1 Tax=Cerasicoccus fimbriatus TaxID=3014554 RepID=UPI0022B4AE9D|nr:hypothetical protein [Cerasicoccus sp. TK19100]
MDRLRKLLCACVLAAWLLPAAPLLAQAKANQCAVDFQIMVFSARKQIASGALNKMDRPTELPDLYYRGAEGYEPLDISHTTLSPSYAYAGATQFTLYARQVRDEEFVYTPVFNVQFGADWKQAIVLLITNSVGEQKSRAVAINTTRENVPTGSILVYNLSVKDLVLNAGKDIYNLPPLIPATVSVANIQNNTLPVQLALKDNDEYKLVYRRKWRMQPDVSGVYFLFTLNDDDRRWFMRNVIL